MQSKEWVAPFLAIPVLFLAFLLFGQRFGLLGQTNEFAEVEYELLLYDDSFVMDVENGRYYAKIKVDDKYKIGVFDADSLALMDVLEESGSFNVDQERDWFYVDDPKLGLTVLDSDSGRLVKRIDFPKPEYSSPKPQVNPSNGNLLLFRDNKMLITDPESEEVLETISFEVIAPDHLETAMNKDRLNSISRSIYDPDSQIIYLFFNVYASGAGYLADIMLSYDLETKQEIERYGDVEGKNLPPSRGVAYEGFLYLSESFKVGTGGEDLHVLWQDGKRQGVVWDKLSRMNPWDFVVDTDRELIYQSSENNVKVWSLQDFRLQWIQPFPLEWKVKHLLGYNPVRQELIFNRNGRLGMIDTDLIKPPVAKNLIPAKLPSLPIFFLAVSPNWPEDQTIIGLWNEDYPSIGAYPPEESCNYVEFSGWGELFISNDGGNNWQKPRGGVQANCMFINDVDVLLKGETVVWRAEFTGKGWYESIDNGRLWQPSLFQDKDDAFESGYNSMHHLSLLRTGSGIGLYDRFYLESSSQLEQRIINFPDGVSESRSMIVEVDDVLFLSFEKQLFRSEDYGETWIEVLNSDRYLDYFVNYGDVMFLQKQLKQNEESPHTVYRSVDGGKTWEQLHFTGCPVVTAVAISPQFDLDYTIFVGTIDGQVVKFNGLTLESIQ